MNDFTCYRIYRAIKLHFTNKKYDVFETNGHIKGLSPEYFESRKEAGWFKALAKKFKNPQEFVQFCVSQVVYGSIDDIFNLDKAYSNFLEWNKNKERSTSLIRGEIEENDIDSLVLGDPPKILRYTISKRIHLETAVAINKYRPFISDKLFKKDYLIFADEAIKIKKLDRFVKYNEDVISQILSR